MGHALKTCWNCHKIVTACSSNKQEPFTRCGMCKMWRNRVVWCRGCVSAVGKLYTFCVRALVPAQGRPIRQHSLRHQRLCHAGGLFLYPHRFWWMWVPPHLPALTPPPSPGGRGGDGGTSMHIICRLSFIAKLTYQHPAWSKSAQSKMTLAWLLANHHSGV